MRPQACVNITICFRKLIVKRSAAAPERACPPTVKRSAAAPERACPPTTLPPSATPRSPRASTGATSTTRTATPAPEPVTRFW